MNQYIENMRKLLLTLLFMALIGLSPAQQRPWKIGIKGGISYIHLENYGTGFYSDFDPKPGWTAGILFQYSKGGFLNYAVAPEIVYTQSITDVDLLYLTDCLSTIQTIDIPVNFKLGLQLSKIFKPYVLVNIYGSYMVEYEGDFFDALDMDKSQPDFTMNRFFWGLSAGMGFDIWKFQVEGRYRWNMNRIRTDDFSSLKQMGLELTCAFLF